MESSRSPGVSQRRAFALWRIAMPSQFVRILVVALVLIGVGAKLASSDRHVQSLPKMRFLLLAEAYRQEIQEKIKGPTLISFSISISMLYMPAACSHFVKADGLGRLALTEKPREVPMPLQL